jgi:UDP-N-acetylmuramate dehydrogenase
MIDACGCKGRSVGAAAVDARHALVLVNRGGARGEEVLRLAESVREAVRERFGIELEYEPVVV